MNKQQVIDLIQSGKTVVFNGSYYPVGYDHQVDELFITSKHDNHSHYLTESDIKNLTVK